MFDGKFFEILKYLDKREVGYGMFCSQKLPRTIVKMVYSFSREKKTFHKDILILVLIIRT